MKTKNTAPREMPSLSQLEGELHREKHRVSYRKALRSTMYTLLAVAAAAVLVSTLWLPVLKIYGSSMTPTLEEGQIVVAPKGSRFTEGDIVAFYYNNKILVKRVIAGPGDWVHIRDDGTVKVNDVVLQEPYLKEKALGECNINLPYQVPDNRYFVMGDHRATSIDSRNTAVGCVSEEQIVGKISFCLWPFDRLGGVG